MNKKLVMGIFAICMVGVLTVAVLRDERVKKERQNGASYQRIHVPKVRSAPKNDTIRPLHRDVGGNGDENTRGASSDVLQDSDDRHNSTQVSPEREMYVYSSHSDTFISEKERSTLRTVETREHTIKKSVKSIHFIERWRNRDDSDRVSPRPPSPIEENPVNPQPGMIVTAYTQDEWMDLETLRESNSTLPDSPALKTEIDKNNTFSNTYEKGGTPIILRWEGFLKCTLAKTYTFVIDKGEDTGCENGYSVWINRDLTVTGYGQNAFDVDLKVGFNRMEIVGQFQGDEPFSITVKPKGSIIEPVQLSPGMFFYDCRPELIE